MASIQSTGSGYVLSHPLMEQTNGVQGVWSYVEGGMGALSTAIGKAAVKYRATLVTNAESSRPYSHEDDHRKCNLDAITWRQIKCHIHILLGALLGSFQIKQLITVSGHHGEVASGGVTKFNVAVNRLPIFSSCSNKNKKPGPEHFGTIHIGAERMDEINSAFQEACTGIPSRTPLIQMTIPSSLDTTIAPSGLQPYELKSGSWRDASIRRDFADCCFGLIDKYAPGFISSVIDSEMLATQDLEGEFGLSGGNIFHGAMGLGGIFLYRPVRGWTSLQTRVFVMLSYMRNNFLEAVQFTII